MRSIPIIQPSQAQPRPSDEPARHTRPARSLRVYMLDLLSIVPYYTGHLAVALAQRDDLRLRLGAITYHLDRQYFSRQKLRLHPGCLNVVSKLPLLPASWRRLLKLVEYLLNCCALLVRFSVSRPDVAHVQFLPMLAQGIPVELWFLRALRCLHIQVVYTVHNILPQGTAEHRRAIYEKVYSVPNALICHDRVVQERLIAEFGVAASRTKVIPHGPLFAPSGDRPSNRARRYLAIAPEQVLVLWQGIVRPYKGVSFLLKAWQQVQAKCPNARLAVVGTGESVLTNAVTEEVAALGIDGSVRLELRFVTESQMASFYSAADILVYPYSEITTSGALMTGLGYGKAIVTTRLEGFEAVLTHGRNALMVRYGDVNALAETLLALVVAPAVRHQLGEAARNTYLQSEGWPEIAASTSAVYQGLVHR